MAKGLLGKGFERAFLNMAGVWGRKAANALYDKAKDQVEKHNVAQRTKKATGNDQLLEDDEGSEDIIE